MVDNLNNMERRRTSTRPDGIVALLARFNEFGDSAALDDATEFLS